MSVSSEPKGQVMPRRPLSPSQRSQITALPGNDKCIDCQAAHPSWCSLGFGVLLCLECSGRHRGMGTHITLVQSLDLDSLTDVQVNTLLEGGNDKFCNAVKPQAGGPRATYTSAAALLYKIQLAARVQGTAVPTELPEHMKSWCGGASRSKPKPRFANSTPAPPFLQLYVGALHFVSLHVIGRLPVWGKGVVVGVSLLGWHHSSLARCVVLGGIGVVTLVFPSFIAFQWQKHRLEADSVAVSSLTERIQKGRAKTTPGYVVFFPPDSKILGDLSDQGILVVLVIAEPLRLPSPSNGFTAEHAMDIVGQVTKLLGLQVLSWCVGGHSLGAFTASKIVQNASIHSRFPISSYLSWASRWLDGNLRQATVNASQNSALSQLRVLTIQAENDPIVDQYAHSTQNFLSQLPLGTEKHVIRGGNHAGFGNYGQQRYPCEDSRRNISLDEQQQQIIQLTLNFLNRRGKKKD